MCLILIRLTFRIYLVDVRLTEMRQISENVLETNEHARHHDDLLIFGDVCMPQ